MSALSYGKIENNNRNKNIEPKIQRVKAVEVSSVLPVCRHYSHPIRIPATHRMLPLLVLYLMWLHRASNMPVVVVTDRQSNTCRGNKQHTLKHEMSG